MPNENTKKYLSMNRRTFLGIGAIASVGAVSGLAGCSPSASSSAANATEPATQANAADFEAKPAAIEESSISETLAYDIVIIGGSSTGLTAAAAAAEEGASVACLEKLDSSMGAGTIYGFINLETDEGTVPIDVVQHAQTLIEASQGMGSPRLIHAFTRSCGEIGTWLLGVARSTGSKFTATPEGTVILEDTEDGTTPYTILSSYGQQHGAHYHFNTAAVQLEQDDTGTITGVLAQNEQGDYVRYNANKGVILATGGYNGNSEMVKRYIPWVEYSALTEFSPLTPMGGNDGDGLKMALWAGAKIGETPHTPMIHFNTGAKPTEGQLFVNARGERFAHEGTSNEVLIEILMRQPGKTGFRVWDNKQQEASLADEETDPYNGLGPQFVSVAEYQGYSTLEDAASALGMDPSVLQSSVDRWNELVTTGIDEDFGADLSNAFTIEDAPFYIEEGPGCSLAMIGGPMISEKMEVLNDDYKAIPHLYAAGNCTCGMYGPNYPMNVHTGLARSFSVVSGYLASKHALGVR